MEEEFLPYNLAFRLEKLNYSKSCFGWYENKRSALSVGESWRQRPNSIDAPLWQQAFYWFQEKYNLHSFIKPVTNVTEIGYALEISTIKHNIVVSKFPLNREESKYYKKYEDARQACLEKLIEIVENDR